MLGGLYVCNFRWNQGFTWYLDPNVESPLNVQAAGLWSNQCGKFMLNFLEGCNIESSGRIWF